MGRRSKALFGITRDKKEIGCCVKVLSTTKEEQFVCFDLIIIKFTCA